MKDLLKETIKEVVYDANKGQYIVLEESLTEENYMFIPQIIEGVKKELDEKTFKRFLTAQTDEFRTNGEEQNVESAINEFLQKYGFSEEDEEEIDEFKAIEEFIKNDNRDLERILVINKHNEIEERWDFNKAEVRASDKKILARSCKNYDCIIDCCDNCDKEFYNEKTGEYECEENQDKTFCAFENQIADQDYLCEILYMIQEQE